jgi:hypothetical protein
MKRLFAIVIACSLALVAAAFAGDEHAGHNHGPGGHSHDQATSAKAAAATKASPAATKLGTWTGEILDAGCYLGNGAMGPRHSECALKCAANGMPLMLLTKEGKAVLLTPNHDNPDAYEQVKKLAGSVAVITGTMNERGGVRGIDVTGAKASVASN